MSEVLLGCPVIRRSGTGSDDLDRFFIPILGQNYLYPSRRMDPQNQNRRIVKRFFFTFSIFVSQLGVRGPLVVRGGIIIFINNYIYKIFTQV